MVCKNCKGQCGTGYCNCIKQRVYCSEECGCGSECMNQPPNDPDGNAQTYSSAVSKSLTWPHGDTVHPAKDLRDLRNQVSKLSADTHRLTKDILQEKELNARLRALAHDTVESLDTGREMGAPDPKRVKIMEEDLKYLVQTVEDMAEWMRMPLKKRSIPAEAVLPQEAVHLSAKPEPFSDPLDVEPEKDESPTTEALQDYQLTATGSNLLAPDSPIDQGQAARQAAPPAPPESPRHPVVDAIFSAETSDQPIDKAPRVILPAPDPAIGPEYRHYYTQEGEWGWCNYDDSKSR